MANEDEKIEICRLCGKDSRNCFAIFQDEDNILEKINTCLPIDISPDDKLPSNVCRCCSYRLSMSYKLRCTAVEVDERLRMQLHQRQSDDVYTNKNANNFSENFLNIKRQIIDEENVLHYQNGTQEIRDKINIYNNWKTKREIIDEISNEKETVISTEDNETAASVNLVTEIVEIKYEDVMEALIEQTDNSSDFVKNETANDCQRFSEHQTLEQNEQSFYCHTCKIKFEKEQYFKIHMNIHEENTINCTCCSAKCSSMYDLFLHKRKKHNMFKNIKRLKYACTKCDKFFAHSSTWENHNKNKCTNMTDKCCKYCKANFTTRTKLILHLKNEHQNIHLEHKCNRCDAVFKEKLVLAEHTREIHNLQSPNKLNTKEKYVCKFCGKKFNSWRLWKNHERIHTEETLSSKCHKSFRSNQSKSHHVQRAHKKKEYVCDLCKKCFSSHNSRWNHVQREHKKKEYICDQCGKCFSSYQSKWRHAQYHKKENLVCDYCGKFFSSYKSKWNHVQREHQKKEYVCDQCGKCFNSYSSRWHHVQREHKKKEYVCDQCGKCYSTKKNLRYHISTHLPVETRKYQCDICQKKFVQNSHLTMHKRIHNAVRPYKCDICSFSSRHLASMKRHRILKHFKNKNKHAKNTLSKNILCNRENFVCDYCGKCFSVKNNLRAHISTHLPVETRNYQ